MQLQTRFKKTFIRLQKRFKISIFSTLNQLIKQVYIIINVDNRRDSINYV